jgi:plastocyanin
MSYNRFTLSIRYLTMRKIRSFTPIGAALLSLVIASGCSGDDAAPGGVAATPAATAAAANPSVTPTGKRVEIGMISDAKGERYEPTDVDVVRGDSLVFPLISGVHNVHFVPSKNPAGVKLPPMSEYLQLPGQKLSYLIDFPEGRYYFQCDIHVALGMVGHVSVKGAQ